MNKLVYLFELDSVRTSPQEIIRGQQALFREIILNENQVVLTFNQLTDSQAFLCAIRNKTVYPHILELFRLGVLRVSRFVPPYPDEAVDPYRLSGEIKECRNAYSALFKCGVLKSYQPLAADSPQRVLRTASHYVQNAVERCLSDDKDAFLFSALPFHTRDKKILTALSYALQYSDPSILDDLELFRFPGEDAAAEWKLAQKRQAYVKRYVEMILHLSRDPLAANPEKTGMKTSFVNMLNYILSFSFKETDEMTKLFPQARAVLTTLLQTAFGSGYSVNNRSNWFDALIQMGQEPPVILAEAVIDLCYNYTMQASIAGFEEHKPSPEKFLSQLRAYWDDGSRGVHQFQKGDLHTLITMPTALLSAQIGMKVC